MYIYNVTFIVESADCERFLEWMRGEAIPALRDEDASYCDARLMRVADIPGDPSFATSGTLTYSLQTSHPTMEQAGEWAETHLYPLLAAYAAKVGPEKALTFATILESLPL